MSEISSSLGRNKDYVFAISYGHFDKVISNKYKVVTVVRINMYPGFTDLLKRPIRKTN